MALSVGATVLGELVSLGSSLIQLAAACVGLASTVLFQRQVRANRRMKNEDKAAADPPGATSV